MLNDIKLTSLGSAIIPNRDAASTSSAEENKKTEANAITVNPHLGQLASTLTDEQSAERSERIASLKQLIDNDSYVVNTGNLANALAASPLITKGL